MPFGKKMKSWEKIPGMNSFYNNKYFKEKGIFILGRQFHNQMAI